MLASCASSNHDRVELYSTFYIAQYLPKRVWLAVTWTKAGGRGGYQEPSGVSAQCAYELMGMENRSGEAL